MSLHRRNLDMRVGGVRERGVVLFIALIVLVAMTLAGIALMRSVGTGVLVAGNLSFKQTTISAADWGVEEARQWLLANGVATANNPTLGYYASWKDNVGTGNFDPRTHPWDDSTSRLVAGGPPGHTIRYVVHRMCGVPGQPVSDDLCAIAKVPQPSSAGAGDYRASDKPPDDTYYRVTVRVVGPRNSVSYAQVFMY